MINLLGTVSLAASASCMEGITSNSSWLLIGLIFVVMLVVMIVPQRRKDKKVKEMLYME